MTFAGKKLQEIYDSGSDRLAEVETGVSTSLKETVKEHVQNRRSGKDLNVTNLEAKSKDLQTELRAFMDTSIERVKATMDEQVKETDEHLSGVKLELVNLSEKLKNTIAELKRSHDETVHHIRTTHCDQYESTVEMSTVELKKQDYVSVKRLRAHGTMVMNSLQQKLDQSLWESRGEEKQYNSALFKTFMQKANSIDTHFSTLMQKLSTDFQTHFKVLEGQHQTTEAELNKSYQTLFDQVDKHADQLELQVQEFFQTTLDSHTGILDASLGTVAHDLSTIHDTTTRNLTGQTRDLSSNLVTSSGEARDALSTKCSDLREQIDSRMTGFRKRTDERAGTTASLRQSLEDERQAIFQKTRAELNLISEGFDKRINVLMSDAISRIHVIEEEAAKDITAAQLNCTNLLKKESQSAKSAIDQSISQFLELLSTQKGLALEEIAKCADGEPTETKKSETKPKRSKK